jgi:beta-glucanase (GH16 family)
MNHANILATALLMAGLAAPAMAAGRMTFDDEFTTFVSSPDGSAGWMTAYPYQGEASRTLSGNNEAEYYSDSSVGVNPFSVHNGVLSIVAAPAAPGSNPYNLPYTSGLITTFGSFSQLYGIFKVRAKLPAGQGLWPAFWLLPSSDIYTAELDVFEVLGQVPTTLYATTHGSTGGVWSSDSQTLQVSDTSQHFHVYSVDWEPLSTNFSIDGRVIATAPTPASMNTPMYMLLNLAVGGAGSWPGPPNASTRFPATMSIDWARAFTSPNTQMVSGRAALLRFDHRAVQ